MTSLEKPFPSDVIIMIDNPTDKKSEKNSVKLYASGVFEESTIGMVSSIVTTQSRARRCFKSLLFAGCISGFIFQSFTYLAHVFEYPTALDIDVQRPERFNLPAYTFCNNNGMKRSVYCDLYPDRCFEPNERFCSRFHSYCESNKTLLVPKKEFYVLEKNMTFEEILKYGDNLTDFLVFNKSDFNPDNITGPYIRTKDEESGAMICYSLNSVVDKKEMPIQKDKEELFDKTFVKLPINKFTFYVEKNEMFIPGILPGVLFSIHSPLTAVNPFIKGTFLKPGTNYKIFVTMEEEVLLRAPFHTECMDYEEIWKENDRTGPRTQKMCEHKCSFGLSLACFRCAATSVLYPNNERKCLEKDFDPNNRYCDYERYLKHLTCLEACKDDCRVIKYIPEFMERYEVDHTDEEDHEDYSRFITVEIYLEEGEILTLRYSPKYLTVEIFSAIGGFIGIWLGVSLMDISDVLASILLVARYGFKKHKVCHRKKSKK